MTPDELTAYLEECRKLVLQEIPAIIPRRDRYHPVLYDLMLDYPLRAGKALRPALCIATCRALGGKLEAVLPSATVLELYHNAFLIHDDVEDGSERRRGEATLHRAHGVPVAVNVGDGMLALTLEPLLDNIAVLGLGKALRILRTVARMARESAEGQALELDWIRHDRWDLGDAEYIRMVYKKTAWYTFIAPLLVGAIAAGASQDQLRALRNFGAVLGIAFQIQDDILNLTGADTAYGKEAAGDLLEGKRTLVLLHALRESSPRERTHAIGVLGRVCRGRRPGITRPNLTATEPAFKRQADDDQHIDEAPSVSSEHIAELQMLIVQHRSVAYASSIARGWASRARVLLMRATDWIEPSLHRSVLERLIDFVVTRES